MKLPIELVLYGLSLIVRVAELVISEPANKKKKKKFKRKPKK